MKMFTVEFLTKSGRTSRVEVIAVGASVAAGLVRERVDCDEVLDVDLKAEGLKAVLEASEGFYGVGQWPATLGELFEVR